MPAFALRARVARGHGGPVRLARDADVLRSHLADAAHFPGGHARELAAPETEAQLADLLRRSAAILPIGAQSSLTGGATPMGELILSTARLDQIEWMGTDRVRVQAGVTLAALDEALAKAGRSYPPAPTFTGACVGGIVATNAAGAATFKYGTTRDWVEALTIVLPSGDVLDVERGATHAHPDGFFELQLARGAVRADIPRYRMPHVPKLSAGYFAAPAMDLIDLFIGSEGTLGVVTAVTLRVLPTRPAVCLALLPFGERGSALRFASRLRDAARDAWRTLGRHGVDVCAIEYMDARSLALLREDGVDRKHGVVLPAHATMALLVTLELPAGTGGEQVFDEIGRAGEGGAADSPLARFSAMLVESGVLDHVEVAVPGDTARARQLLAFREGVPEGVNQRVGRARTTDPRIHKTAADMIVPFEKLAELLNLYDDEFRRRGLDAAIWGHLSDGNVHPNVIPRSHADVESGQAAIRTFGGEVIRLGGAPLAEHGVGRSPLKQQLLKALYGLEGIDQMRRVKRAIDPEWKLAPGVLFPK